MNWDHNVLKAVLGVFGEPVVYRPTSGASFAANGLFNEAYHEVALNEDQAPVTTEQPVIDIRLAEIAAPVQGDRLSVRGSTYIVREVRLDGVGGARLMLNFVSTP